MKLVLAFSLLAMSCFAQSAVTKGNLTVQVVTLTPARLAFMPVAPSDLNLDIIEVFASTINPATARFKISLSVTTGDAVVQMTQLIDRNPQMMSLAIFRVPTGSKLSSPVSVTELMSPVDF